MGRYAYEGPVKSFGICVNNCWRGETIANSEKKARSNLTYQYKKQFKKSADCKVELTGKLTLIE